MNKKRLGFSFFEVLLATTLITSVGTLTLGTAVYFYRELQLKAQDGIAFNQLSNLIEQAQWLSAAEFSTAASRWQQQTQNVLPDFRSRWQCNASGICQVNAQWRGAGPHEKKAASIPFMLGF